MTLTVKVPVPPKALNKNRRPGQNWGSLKRHTEDYRNTCAWHAAIAVSANLTIEEKATLPRHSARLTVRWFHRSNRERLDPMNVLTPLQPAVDALQVPKTTTRRGVTKELPGAGIITDDKYLEIAGIEQAVDARNPRVELVLELGGQ